MRAKTGDAGLFGLPVSIEYLIGMRAEFSAGSGIGDEFADFAFAIAWIDAEREQFRATEFQDSWQQGGVIEIEDDSAFESLADIVIGEEITAEHDIFAAESEFLCEQDFIDAGGIYSGSFLAQDIGDGQVVVGFDGVEEAEIGIVFLESLQGSAKVVTDAVFFVDISRRAISGGQRSHRHLFQKNLTVDDLHSCS